MTVTGVAVRDAIDSALVALRGVSVDTPRLDAEILLAHALAVERTALALDPDRPVAGDAARWFRDAVRRRAFDRVPVAYLVGRKAFRRIELEVDERVLIPRPETEHLVEAALALPHGARVHDVGTGSGAVALALKEERPDLVVSGSDVSPEAVTVAHANAARLGLDVTFAVADLLDGVGPVDAVVANLPYVADDAPLAPEIARHEPAVALYAGADGLALLRRFAAAAGDVAWVALEVGEGQAAAVAALFPERTVRVDRDLARIERVVVAWRD